MTTKPSRTLPCGIRAAMLCALAMLLPPSSDVFAQTGEIAVQPSPDAPLAAAYVGNDGGAYYVTEAGRFVYWFAEHPGRDYAHVFKGTRSGHVIEGKYWSVPKGTALTHGTVRLARLAGGRLAVREQSGGFPAVRFRPTSIAAIGDRLPRRTGPRFTQTGPRDLDGVFDTGNGYRLYARERAGRVAFFAEMRFESGEQPHAAAVFVGSRDGDRIRGHLVPVPKGRLRGPRTAAQRADFVADVAADRTLRTVEQLEVFGRPLFGAGPIRPVLPDIRIPVDWAMKALEVFEDNLSIHLDGYDKNGNGLRDGSHITVFGERMPPFTLPRTTINPKRWTYLNDVSTENVDFDALGGGKGRLDIRFEQGGRELKRYCGSCCVRSLHGDDGQLCDDNMTDWNMDNIRASANLELVNFDGGISYRATDFRWHAELEDTPHIDAVENWLSGIIRREVEETGLTMLNARANRVKVRDAIDEMLRTLPGYLERYAGSPYALTGVTPTGVSIDGDDIVFRFR